MNISTLGIWIITVVTVVAFYELTKYLLCLFTKNRFRSSACLLVCVSIYPHYYMWWILFNYINDGFYKQIYHQVSV